MVEIFRRPDGSLDWGSALTAEQLRRRARSLLDLKLDDSAAAALDAVPAAGRDLDWILLAAETLTRRQRGSEALSLLGSRTASDPRQAAALEWARAMAAEEMATARRGRGNLSTAERRQARDLARQSFRKVVQTGADPELTAKALRALYANQIEDNLFEPAMATLRQPPQGGSGGRDRRGLPVGPGMAGVRAPQLQRRSRLLDGALRPLSRRRQRPPRTVLDRPRLRASRRNGARTADLRRGGRGGHHRLLSQERPRAAAPKAASSPRGGAATEPWPDDPAVARARLLTDLGLEDLALSEQAELVRANASPRAATALEALVLARQGDRRKSVVAIRDAFPALGGAYQATLPEEARRLYYPLEYQDTIRAWASRNQVPLHLVFGIIRQESAFDRNAQSWAGARGLMQLMPGTARELAAKLGLAYSHDKLSDPDFNLRLGTSYLSRVLGMFDGNVELALAGYNGGPYRIKRLWREWGGSEMDRFLESLNIEESKTYVKRILVLSDSYRQLYSISG